MKRTIAMWTLVAATGCGAPEPAPDSKFQPGSSRSELVVFHTHSSVMTVPATAQALERLRVRVENFYPAACIDRDDDGDGLPNTLEPHSSSGSSGDALRCHSCNRGPGTNGDFRLETRGEEFRLDRGRVSARTGSQLEVPSPSGKLVIPISGSTEIRDGDPVPGAEIRVEGRLTPAGIQATFIKVLCPGPGIVPEGALPDGATPVPGDGPIAGGPAGDGIN